MKKGYTKILIIEILMIVFLLFNSFIKNFLFNYFLVLFLFLSLCLYRIFFGFERDKHRNTKDIIIYIFSYLIVVIILYYAMGIFTGYARIQNYYNINSIFNIILPIILTTIIGEFFRYQLLRKSEGNFKLITLTTILFIFIEITNSIYFANFSSGYNIMLFIGLYLFPSISKNIFSTYISIQTGYKPVIIFNLFMGLHKYLLLIVPNFSEYFQSIFYLVIPAILTIRLYKILNDNSNAELVSKQPKKVIRKIIYVAEIILIILLICLISGYFKYYAIAIASNSMGPTFERGSAVIIKKIGGETSELKIGDIIAYKYQNKIIAHRIVKITNIDGSKYFYTKGDANEHIDNYIIKEDMIIGTIDIYMPFIGYPTIWVNEILTN